MYLVQRRHDQLRMVHMVHKERMELQLIQPKQRQSRTMTTPTVNSNTIFHIFVKTFLN